MVRRGSTVRVRQRAFKSPAYGAFSSAAIARSSGCSDLEHFLELSDLCGVEFGVADLDVDDNEQLAGRV
jgi:hypothetical protein